jgi:cytochrome c biogenesis protein
MSSTLNTTSRSFLNQILSILGSMLQEFLKTFRSVHLAIVLLSLLAIGTIIGVVMPQDGMKTLSEIRAVYGRSFEFYRSLGLFHVYSSFWYLSLQVLFFFNLLIGSFQWLRPAILAATQQDTLAETLLAKKQKASSFRQLYRADSLTEASAHIVKTLQKSGYRVYQDPLKQDLYATKGNLSRFGPMLAHIGILLCLIAGLYGTFTGLKAQKIATPGDSFSIEEANMLKTNVSRAYWLGTIPAWKIKVRDFRIEFYAEKPDMAKQYYSDLQLISPEGKILKEGTISVNSPLSYGDVSIYQASYAPTGRFIIRVNNTPILAEINSTFNGRPISMNPMKDGSMVIMFPFFAQQDPGVTKDYAMFFVRKPGDKPLPGKMPANIKLFRGSTGMLNSTTITYIKPEMSTGVQIKQAPEVPLMYTSYLIIILGAVLCFFSQRQIWMSLTPVRQNLYAVSWLPKTNKAQLSFMKELHTLRQKWFGQE